MAYRVALLGIYHESNTFLQQQTTEEDFRNGHWLWGEDILREYGSAFHEIGGMMEGLQGNDIELLPVMFAEATPGGIIKGASYELLLESMLNALDSVLPVDGCMVVPHGAAVAVGYEDMDGHWLQAVRKKVGAGVPVIGTLDPHANVSKKMAEATDALVAYATNPHIDQRQTGIKAANLMVASLQGKCRPVQRLLQLPVAISIEQQCTSREPCKSLLSFAKSFEDGNTILSVSTILGFPYADVEAMGSAFIIVSNGHHQVVDGVAEGLFNYVVDRKESFIAARQNIEQVLPVLAHSAKPVLLLDMGDNIGGGSSGSGTCLLKELEEDGRYQTFICICDPAAVEQSEQYKLQDNFSLSFGHEYESEGDPFTTTVTLLKLADGKFSETNPRHGGQVNFNMGRIAIVRTAGGNIVMLTTLRVPPFSLRQITAFGIRPGDFDVIVAKGVNAPIAAYEQVVGDILQVDTPGVTRADMTAFPYKNRRKPLFPFEP